jgi:peptidyl-prolyl cis-trans isomerase B (cyclophilin B)
VSRTIVPLAATLALALAACGGSDTPKASSATPAPAAASKLDANGCQPTDWPAPKDATLKLAKAKLDPAKTYVAAVDTNCGAFEITLDAKRAPKTGGAFQAMADGKVYDGTAIHRIVSGFVFQGGDPKGDGTGDAGFKVVEAPPKDLVYTEGVVAMAKGGTEAPGTSGSQFFVVTGSDASQLPPDYALLGQISGGEDVTKKIGAIVADPNTGRPDAPVVIRSIRVTER